MGKNGAEATDLINSTLGDNSVSHSTVKKWFGRFRDGNLCLEDDPRPGIKRKAKDEDLEALLEENTAQTQHELANQLGVTQQTISVRLQALGKIQKEGKWVSKR